MALVPRRPHSAAEGIWDKSGCTDIPIIVQPLGGRRVLVLQKVIASLHQCITELPSLITKALLLLIRFAGGLGRAAAVVERFRDSLAFRAVLKLLRNRDITIFARPAGIVLLPLFVVLPPFFVFVLLPLEFFLLLSFLLLSFLLLSEVFLLRFGFYLIAIVLTCLSPLAGNALRRTCIRARRSDRKALGARVGVGDGEEGGEEEAEDCERRCGVHGEVQ